MSLIKCKECGKEISDKAEKCPSCGCPIEKDGKNFQESQPIKVEVSTKKSKFGTAKLIIGIISIFLFIIISFQSCAAGISNAIGGSKEASGSFGMIVAILITISGIVSISTRNSIKKGGSIWCTVLYYLCSFFAIVGAGRYTDLKLWGFLSFCFGFVHLISITYSKKSKIICSVCSALFILFLIASSGTSDEKTANEVPNSDTEETNAVDKSDNESNKETEQNESEEDFIEEDFIEDDDNTINFVTDKISITYTGFEIQKDYEGNDCVIIYYDFTNNRGENANAMLSTYMQVFQEGVECESAMLSFDSDVEEINNSSKDIQSGNTIKVANAYSIKSDSDITIEASEAFSFNNAKDTMILKIK